MWGTDETDGPDPTDRSSWRAGHGVAGAVPFFVLAFFIGSTRWILRYSNAMMKVGGALMLFLGILLFTDQMTKITIWLQQITPDWMII